MKKIVGTVCLVALVLVVSLVGLVLAFCLAEDPALFQAVTAAAANSAEDAIHAAGSSLASGIRSAGEGLSSAAFGVRAWFDRTTVLEAVPGVQAHLALRVSPPPEESPQPEQAPAPEDGAVTALILRDGREILTGGTEVVYYHQKDEAWVDQSYGGDPIGKYGCGPTVMSMAVSSLTGTQIDPAEMAAWCADRHYNASKSGSRLSIVAGTAEGFGLTCASLSAADPEGLVEALSKGGAAVALMGPGHFTSGGHFILLHGVTQDGQVLVADPNSRENCLVPWDAGVILDELSAKRSDGAPLWYLSLPAQSS